MKRILVILVLLSLPVVAVAQTVPLFPALSWGLHFAEVTHVDGHDALVPYADTILGRPCLVDYRFDAHGALVAIDLDFTRPHTTASPAVAAQTIDDMGAIHDSLAVRFGYVGTALGYYRSGRDCRGDGAEQLASGCQVHWFSWADEPSIVDQIVDAAAGRVEHRLILRSRAIPSSVDALAAPGALDLR